MPSSTILAYAVQQNYGVTNYFSYTPFIFIYSSYLFFYRFQYKFNSQIILIISFKIIKSWNLKSIYYDKSIKLSHKNVFSYRSITDYSQNLTLKFVIFIWQKYIKTESIPIRGDVRSFCLNNNLQYLTFRLDYLMNSCSI